MLMEYTNSPLVEYTRLSPYNSGQRTHAIDRITPHCVVGQITAKALGEWFSGNNRQASSNYGIGLDGRVGMYCPESVRSWCSSSPANDQRAITIECASDTKHPYAFRDVVYNRLIELCADICQRNGKTKLIWIGDKAKRLSYEPAQDEMVLTVHRDFFDTDCPGQWLMDRMGDLAEKVTALLAQAGEETEQDPPAYSDDGPEIVTPPANPLAYQEPDPEPVQQTAPANHNGTQAKDLAALSNVEIVNTVGPLFTEDQRKTGILASVSMAQFILESGYCREELARNTNNCFGMKCTISGNTWPGTTWDGESSYKLLTGEYTKDGKPFEIYEYFRAYLRIEDSLADHSAYLRGAMNGDKLRYDGLVGCTDYRQAAQIIKDGGYATAPDYVDALCQIIEMWGLTKWDLPQEQPVPETGNSTPETGNSLPETGSGVHLTPEEWNIVHAAHSALSQVIQRHESEG